MGESNRGVSGIWGEEEFVRPAVGITSPGADGITPRDEKEAEA